MLLYLNLLLSLLYLVAENHGDATSTHRHHYGTPCAVHKLKQVTTEGTSLHNLIMHPRIITFTYCAGDCPNKPPFPKMNLRSQVQNELYKQGRTHWRHCVPVEFGPGQSMIISTDIAESADIQNFNVTTEGTSLHNLIIHPRIITFTYCAGDCPNKPPFPKMNLRSQVQNELYKQGRTHWRHCVPVEFGPGQSMIISTDIAESADIQNFNVTKCACV